MFSNTKVGGKNEIYILISKNLMQQTAFIIYLSLVWRESRRDIIIIYTYC